MLNWRTKCFLRFFFKLLPWSEHSHHCYKIFSTSSISKRDSYQGKQHHTSVKQTFGHGSFLSHSSSHLPQLRFKWIFIEYWLVLIDVSFHPYGFYTSWCGVITMQSQKPQLKNLLWIRSLAIPVTLLLLTFPSLIDHFTDQTLWLGNV